MYIDFIVGENKEEIWRSAIRKVPTVTETDKKQRDITKTPPTFDYTTIADRLRTISWSNDSQPTGVVEPAKGVLNLPPTTTVM